MKVYVVYSIYDVYEGIQNIKIFSTKEKAEKDMKSRNDNGNYYEHCLFEYDLDSCEILNWWD